MFELPEYIAWAEALLYRSIASHDLMGGELSSSATARTNVRRRLTAPASWY
jgi:hypothetical protein